MRNTLTEQAGTAARKALTGKVIEVLNDYEVVINKGSADGVNMDDRFLLYKEGREIIDPENQENLGRLELVCGVGKPTHIQERSTRLKSSMVRIRRKLPDLRRSAKYLMAYTLAEEETISLPFDKAEKGDLFKQVR